MASEQLTQIMSFLSGGAILLIMQYYLTSYSREKGKNLATKEDIEAITDKIESVKGEHAKQFENYKLTLWQEQQAQLWAREESKLKIETFKKSVTDVAKVINLVKQYQMLISERELALAAAGIAKDEENGVAYKMYWDKHQEYMEQAHSAYTDFREITAEMSGLFALFSIYFNFELTNALTTIVRLAYSEVEMKMSRAKFSELLKNEYVKSSSLEAAREVVGVYYDGICAQSPLPTESQRFFDLLKMYVNSESSGAPAREETRSS